MDARKSVLTLAKNLPFDVRKSIMKYKEQEASANSCLLLLFRKGVELYSTSSEGAEEVSSPSWAGQDCGGWPNINRLARLDLSKSNLYSLLSSNSFLCERALGVNLLFPLLGIIPGYTGCVGN